jgi:phosphatidylserine decarboxylase
MITKYGYDVFLAVTIIVVVIIALAFLIDIKILRYGIITVASVFFLLTVNFFRDPERQTPQGENLVISPADGRVCQITTTHDSEYLNADAVQVSIFMSPLDVHVNRVPCSGKVGFYKYVKGEYLVAFEDKSSERNERTLIGIENGKYKILFKQIAGFLARRIVCTLNVGDSVKAGERFGMIKFGSRVDVLLPTSAEIKVKLDDVVKAGESVLAILR